MSINIQVKAERTSRAQHSKNVYATGHVDLVVDGVPAVRLYNFRLTYSPKNSKWFINEPSRSIESINPQTGAQEKRWLSQWQLFPGNKEAREQWMNSVMQQVFQQVPDPTKAIEDVSPTPGYAPQAAPAPAPVAAAPAPTPGYGAPPAAPAGYGAPPAAPAGYGAPPQAAPAPVAPPPGYGAPPAPAAPPGYGAPPVPGAASPGAPPVPAAPGAPPVPAGPGPAFPVGPVAPRTPSPTQHMPQNPAFPLPPA